jgi:hypothetical protein
MLRALVVLDALGGFEDLHFAASSCIQADSSAYP